MTDNTKMITSSCDFSGVKPAVMNLPYPPVQVRERNKEYAALISVSYCGSISEVSAVMQYINNESRMFNRKCKMGRTILGMAMAEMAHMQILAELLGLLGGTVCYTSTHPGGQQQVWSPHCLAMPEDIGEMLQADLEREMATIDQYDRQIQRIRDEGVNAVLNRIVQDEQYHIMLLRSMMDTL